ncbi:MAG: hypothetical protein ACYS3N_13750 [Planctomycetota bacterium]|jgi:hypothetical protein
MKSDETKSSEKERDEAAVEQLRQLTRKLCSNDITTARLAAHNLSWMQEDGLAIFTETLMGNYSRTTKKAAAYGLRSMKGRMKKLASEVLEQGLRHRDRTTKAACVKAISLMKGGPKKKAGSQSKSQSSSPQIQEMQKRRKRNTEDKRSSSR